MHLPVTETWLDLGNAHRMTKILSHIGSLVTFELTTISCQLPTHALLDFQFRTASRLLSAAGHVIQMYNTGVNKTPRGTNLCLSTEQRHIETLESWQHFIIWRGKCNEDEPARQSMAQDGHV